MKVFYCSCIFGWRGGGFRHGTIRYYRYRYDSVPSIHRRRKGKQFKKGNNALSEKRRCYVDKKYIRGKRAFSNLPDNWDDNRRGDFKFNGPISWKNNKKIKRQYMKNWE